MICDHVATWFVPLSINACSASYRDRRVRHRKQICAGIAALQATWNTTVCPVSNPLLGTVITGQAQWDQSKKSVGATSASILSNPLIRYRVCLRQRCCQPFACPSRTEGDRDNRAVLTNFHISYLRRLRNDIWLQGPRNRHTICSARWQSTR